MQWKSGLNNKAGTNYKNSTTELLYASLCNFSKFRRPRSHPIVQLEPSAPIIDRASNVPGFLDFFAGESQNRRAWTSRRGEKARNLAGRKEGGAKSTTRGIFGPTVTKNASTRVNFAGAARTTPRFGCSPFAPVQRGSSLSHRPD